MYEFFLTLAILWLVFAFVWFIAAIYLIKTLPPTRTASLNISGWSLVLTLISVAYTITYGLGFIP